MAFSQSGKQLASRAQAKLRGYSQSQLQRQLAVYQQLSGVSPTATQEIDDRTSGRVRSAKSRSDSKRPAAQNGAAKRLNGPLTKGRLFRTPVQDPPSQPQTVDSHKARQNIANLARGLYGTPVTGQVGPNGEIYFASERNRYADIGYWYQGKGDSAQAPQTSFVLTPPFQESAVALTCSTDYQPTCDAMPQGSPPGARIINFVSSPFPKAHDSHAIALIGGVVPIPPGFSVIRVTTTAVIQSSMQVWTDGLDTTHASHFFDTTIEGPGFSPKPQGKFLEWQFGTTAPPLHPAPMEESISVSWNLGGRHGDFLVLVGVSGNYHCFGMHSKITAGCWIDVKSIRVEVT